MTEYASLPRALILCRDSRLARLLENELSALGISARTVESLPPPDGEPCLLVADGDDILPTECADLAERLSCPLLMFGRGITDPPLVTKGCAFLRRPFSLTELEEAARSLLSGTPTAGAPSPAIPRPASTHHEPQPWVLSPEKGVVTVGGVPVPLTATEMAILECLYAHRGETVSRDELASLPGGGGNSVEVYVCHLRRKLEKPLGRRMIVTVRGVGYRLEGHALVP